MRGSVFALVLLAVVMSACAQVVLKHAMAAPAVQQALRVGLVSSVLAAARSPIVWLGLLTYGLGAVLWLGVLAQMDVGQAYPLVGIGFLLTMVFGIVFLGEAVSPARIAGTALVVVGIALVAGT